MAVFNYEAFEKNLPDAFRKDKKSNNYKLLSVEKHIYNKIATMLQSIYDIIDMDNATGETLDMYGKRLNLKRGKAQDEAYRIRLKTKIAQSFSDGSRDSIARAVAFVLSTTPNRIKLQGGEKTVDILDLPLETLLKADISEDEVKSIIAGMLPQGVSVGTSEFSGTFEFGEAFDVEQDGIFDEADGEFDENSGFADLDGTVGGYFGLYDA